MHDVKHAHWMTQLTFLEALQSLAWRRGSSTTQLFEGVWEIEVGADELMGC